jgi:hypothetical protein
MSGRSLHRLAVTGLMISFGLLPLSAAQAAPVSDQTATVSGTVRAWGLSLLESFQAAVGYQPDSPESMAQDQDHDIGSDPHDGVGIDPHGRPRG